MNWKIILALIRKDAFLEWRQKHTIFGVLLYMGSTIFALYMMNGSPEPRVWNALFWLTQLFVSVNSVAKSFLQESSMRYRYYYSICSPLDFIIAKQIYSIVLQIFVSLVSLGLFWVMLGNPLEQSGLFVLLTVSGGAALASVFTFLSAIAAKANQNASLMAILGFPVITPMLLIMSKLSQKTLMPVFQEGWWALWAVLILFLVLILILSAILFPFLWKE
jgi:heme exporter protein B